MSGQKSTSSNTLSTKWAEQHLHDAPGAAVGINHGRHFALPGGPAAPTHALSGSSQPQRSLPAGSKAAAVKCEYSRYQDRYLDRPCHSDPLSGFVHDPAASWLPYGIYGGLCLAACIVWFVWALGIKDGSIISNPQAFTAGIVILAVAAVGAAVIGLLTAAVSAHSNANEKSSDIYATAIGKTTAVLVVFLVVWFICMTIASA